MRGLLGLVLTLLIAFGAYKMYFSQMQSASGAGPAQSISATGVKNDLVAIGQAERMYLAEHGSYATLDQLGSSGSMSMIKSGRAGFTYSVAPSGNSFRAEARCTSSNSACTGYAIDETMEIHPLQ